MKTNPPPPRKRKKVCSAPGCQRTTTSRRCEVHRPKDERPTAHQRGYTARWRRYRKTYLAGHPLCKHCLEAGRTIPATEVDHITPINGDADPLFWAPSNHQPLCKSCHSTKTAKDRKA